VPGTGSFNALHAGKSAYVFAASSEEDAGAWVGAINAAIARSEVSLAGGTADGGGSAAEARRDRAAALAWAVALEPAKDGREYRKALRRLCRERGQVSSAGGGRAVSRASWSVSQSDLPPRPVLSVDGSWARVQLRAAWERDASPGDGSSLVTTGRGPDPGSPAFAAHASASAASSGGFTSAYHAGAMAGSPRRGGMGQRATSEGSTTAAVLAAAARIEPRATARMPFAPRLRVLRSGGDEGMERTVRAAERAVAEAAAAASRRLWGFQPGDRASLHQLSVDVGRDCTVVQGVPMAAARLESLVRAVVGAVRQAAAAATTGAGASPPGDEGEVGDGGRGAAGEGEGSDEEEDCGEEARLPGGGVPSSALERVAGEDARLMEFASDVLSGSCRTVAGGDAYEALELAMRCPGAAVIVPQSDLASPVVLTAVGAGGTYTPPPVRVLPLTAAAEGADTAGLTIATEALSSREEEDAARAQGVERGRGAAFVVADTCVFYRIKASDMQTDEEQDAEDDEPPAAGAPAPTGGDRSFSDDESDGEAPDAAPVSLPWQRGDVAFVAAHYRRVFPLGSFAGNGTVRVYAVARRGGGDRAGDA